MTEAAWSAPLVFAYADPPYPGKARRCYGTPEVDHQELVASLLQGGYAGWALSTGAYALRELLPLCPADVRVCAWVKPMGVSRQTQGLHNAWEALIVSPGRKLRPGVRDWLRAMPARGGGQLIGRKPLAFCGWLFDALGMVPGDRLVDLFPGTGVVGRAWAELSRHASLGAGGDASLLEVGDASPAAAGHASPRASRNASPRAARHERRCVA